MRIPTQCTCIRFLTYDISINSDIFPKTISILNHLLKLVILIEVTFGFNLTPPLCEKAAGKRLSDMQAAGSSKQIMTRVIWRLLAHDMWLLHTTPAPEEALPLSCTNLNVWVCRVAKHGKFAS